MSEFKIEVGKSYRTRDGRKATVDRYEWNILHFPFVGNVDGKPRSSSWSPDGRYLRQEDHHLDLVAPWEETPTTLCAADLCAADVSSAFNAQAEIDDGTEVARRDDYEVLRAVLDEAFDQSAHGKGKERHANDKPFDRQPIMEIGRMVGPGGPSFQAMKKMQEALGMVKRGDREAAVRELLGSIVYAAATVALIREGGE